MNEDMAHVEALVLSNYIKHQLKRRLRDALGTVEMTEAQVAFVAETLCFSALRLPVNCRLQLLEDYVEIPKSTRPDFQSFAQEWESGDDAGLPSERSAYKVHARI